MPRNIAIRMKMAGDFCFFFIFPSNPKVKKAEVNGS